MCCLEFFTKKIMTKQSSFPRDTGGILADPQFKNITGHSFTLQLSSQRIDKGISLQPGKTVQPTDNTMKNISAASNR
jgi:hypothetical protein